MAFDYFTELQQEVEREVMACIGCNDCLLACPLPDKHFVTIAQLNAGAQARPRTPDWNKVESIIGTELNIALAAGSGGGAAMDTAATKVKDYLTQVGYY